VPSIAVFQQINAVSQRLKALKAHVGPSAIVITDDITGEHSGDERYPSPVLYSLLCYQGVSLVFSNILGQLVSYTAFNNMIIFINQFALCLHFNQAANLVERCFCV